jgi:hypothetical protein
LFSQRQWTGAKGAIAGLDGSNEQAAKILLTVLVLFSKILSIGPYAGAQSVRRATGAPEDAAFFLWFNASPDRVPPRQDRRESWG